MGKVRVAQLVWQVGKHSPLEAKKSLSIDLASGGRKPFKKFEGRLDRHNAEELRQTHVGRGNTFPHVVRNGTLQGKGTLHSSCTSQ